MLMIYINNFFTKRIVVTLCPLRLSCVMQDTTLDLENQITTALTYYILKTNQKLYKFKHFVMISRHLDILYIREALFLLFLVKMKTQIKRRIRPQTNDLYQLIKRRR